MVVCRNCGADLGTFNWWVEVKPGLPPVVSRTRADRVHLCGEYCYFAYRGAFRKAVA